MIEQTCGEQPNIHRNLRLHNNSNTAFFDIHNDELKLEKNASSNITVAELLLDNANNKDNILYLCHFMASSRWIAKIALLIIFLFHKNVCEDFMSQKCRELSSMCRSNLL